MLVMMTTTTSCSSKSNKNTKKKKNERYITFNGQPSNNDKEAIDQRVA